MNYANCGRAAVAVTTLCLSAAALGQYEQTNLVSDGSVPARHTDPNLVNPWGISLGPTGPFWVSDNGTGVSTLYDGDGNPFPISHPLIVTIPPAGEASPTGTVFNGGNGFKVSANGHRAPAKFLFVTEEGTISGWAPTVDATNAIMAVDNSA